MLNHLLHAVRLLGWDAVSEPPGCELLANRVSASLARSLGIQHSLVQICLPSKKLRILQLNLTLGRQEAWFVVEQTLEVVNVEEASLLSVGEREHADDVCHWHLDLQLRQLAVEVADGNSLLRIDVEESEGDEQRLELLLDHNAHDFQIFLLDCLGLLLLVKLCNDLTHSSPALRPANEPVLLVEGVGERREVVHDHAHFIRAVFIF